MNKKILSSFIALMFILGALPSGIAMSAPPSADKPRDPTEAETSCKDYAPQETYKQVMQDVASNKIPMDYGNVHVAFDTMRLAYHTYVECLFSFASEAMLGTAWLAQTKTTMGTISVNVPNVPDVPDWLKPDLACQDEKKLSAIMKRTSPNVVLTPLLESHQLYADQLKKLADAYNAAPKSQSGTNLNFARDASQVVGIKHTFDMELQDAWTAMSTTLISLKEMRLAFVMHVHFQCMLNNLERYRRMLEDLRIVIETLPSLLHDASVQ